MNENNKNQKKRVLKREPISNLNANHMDRMMGGTDGNTSKAPDCFTLVGCPTVFTCTGSTDTCVCGSDVNCTGKPTSQYTCAQTNWYCCL